MIEKLTEILKQFFSNKTFDISNILFLDFIDDLGMDSLTFIDMVIEIENQFELVIPDECLTFENFRNIEKIHALICDIKNGDRNE